jgi:hypothetical protein
MASQEDENLYALFYETVLLPYTAYRTIRMERKAGTRNDWNAAITACTSAYHFREHLPDRYKKSHKHMVSLCRDFALLGNVVNASKHNRLTKGGEQITSVDNIKELVVSTRYSDEAGEYTNAAKSIEVTLKSGETRELFDVLTNVVNMWIEFLRDMAISGKAVPFAHEDRNRAIRREDAGQIVSGHSKPATNGRN